MGSSAASRLLAVSRLAVESLHGTVRGPLAEMFSSASV